MKTIKLFNRSVILRERKFKKRYEMSKGKCFYSVQCGKFGIYVEHGKSRSIGFKTIKDVYRTKIKKFKLNTHVETVTAK